MQRNGVIHDAGNAAVSQALLNDVAACSAARIDSAGASRAAIRGAAGNGNRVEVVDVVPAWRNARQRDARQICQQSVVAARVGLARGGPVCQMAQFYAQDGGLQLIQTAVPAALRADVAATLPVVAQRPESRS